MCSVQIILILGARWTKNRWAIRSIVLPICVTALLAATAISGSEAIPALEIAIVPLIYNVLGVIVIYGLPTLRPLPVIGAETLAVIAAERKYLALVYIATVFFLVPGILLGVSALT